MKTYLGDSVYADSADYQLRLTTENGIPDDPSNEIYMGTSELKALIYFALLEGYLEKRNLKEIAST